MANLDDYRWLTSSPAEPWLAIQAADPVRLLSRLRKDLAADRAHLIAEQIDLRRRAREKFRLADRMFFTRKGLEQATDDAIAASKASRFPTNVHIADLCCGIGGDSLAFCTRGPTSAFDCNDVSALFASANAQVHGFTREQYTAVAADITTTELPAGPWHCDPDRRPTGRRATRGDLFEPSLEILEQLLAQNPDAAIKLAPATDAPSHWQQSAELQWLESRGECRQQVAWFGNLAQHPGRRSATIILPAGRTRTIIGDADESPPAAIQIGRYLYEPAAAVLAAKLTPQLCRQHSLAMLSPGIAYLAGDNLIDDPALAAFEILDILPFDRKQLRAYCRDRKIGRLEIKKRGVELDPARLRQELVASGDNGATMLIAPYEQKVKVFCTHRINSTKY